MNKFKTFLPVFAAGLVFIIAQYFIVRQVWVQRSEVFQLRYRSVSKEALEEMMIKTGNDGFEKAHFMIDYIAQSQINKSRLLFTTKDSTGFQNNVVKNINSILTEDQELSKYLSSYFDKLGLDKKFEHKIFIEDLYLFDFNTSYNVYKAPASEIKKQKNQGNILVNTFENEGNNFYIRFNYYIDISNKEKIILREIGLILILSITSMAIISILFIATLRNYLEEKRLSSLKTDFINNMTHELKTPLSTITVAGKTLELDVVLNSQEKILETASLIGKQSIHLNKLINLILEISMWERTQFEIEKKDTNIEEVLKDICQSFRNGSGNKCELTETYTLENNRAKIDILYFTTMINNLLNNAVKYSTGKAKVSISASNSDGTIIRIADSGIGISRSDQKSIFDKFYRVTTGNIHKTKGLGLGLYYVKNIAEAHGGTVTVSSKQGKGSVFIVYIP